MHKTAFRKAGPFAGLYLSLVFPSLGQVQKYLGITGVFLYCILVFLALSALYRYCLAKLLSRMTNVQASLMAALTIICLVIIFLLVYPVVNSRTDRSGSDRDDEANIAASELLGLRYPYYQKTYLGNRMTRFPGAILLSVPFVLLGNSAFQNFFWLAIFFILARSLMKDGRLALILFLMILFFSPVVMHELLTGGDLLANTIYILSFIFFLVRSVCTVETKTAKRVLAAVLLGVGLSSRVSFILLLPLVFSILVQNADLKSAFKYTGLAASVFLAVTLPFYLYDPAGFSPLYWQFSKIGRFDSILPFSGIVVTISGVIIALALCLRSMKDDYPRLLINCALVLFFPVLAAVILNSTKEGRLNLLLSGYGMNFLFFGAPAFWYLLTQKVFLQNRS